MPRLGTFEARIKIDGVELLEHEIEVDEQGKKVSCWVPSQARKAFSVCWNNLEPVLDTAGSVTLGGAKAQIRSIEARISKKRKRIKPEKREPKLSNEIIDLIRPNHAIAL
ncbi:hypothetical protein AMATHDRAFT_5863 [Amanita thiersii Skay4041]|uniref:Uncharacterized protein n=1 Tax=Amanita thiersii Skay4041 TaxID=703135 RepID=A0A2A9NCM5_9AGAR|nr:hypothetical protein AMATHDRAFT_5863 [Amanita thiersii Skay4041]